MEFNRIKEIITGWDPVDLLNHAPDDEYDFEIQQSTDSVLCNGKKHYEGLF